MASRARWVGVAVFAATFVVFAPLSPTRASSYDGRIMQRVATGLAEHGTNALLTDWTRFPIFGWGGRAR